MTIQTSFNQTHPAVTVRQIGEAKPAADKARNLIERAALCANVDDAAAMLQAALGIGTGDLASHCLSEPARWSRISEPSRLMEIGEWLKAEAFELMDLVSVPSISTKGD